MSKLFLTILVIVLALPAVWLPITSSRAGEPPQPRNGRIAFSAPAAGGEHIFSIDPQGGSRLQLTTEGSTNKYPAWSSDGTKIVFSSNRTGQFELWTMRADGGAQTQTRTELPGVKIVPQLSPDGTTIVFGYFDPAVGHPEVWRVSANGSNAQRLTTTPTAPAGPKFTGSLLPHFSPDGLRIVYASTKSGSTQIWTMNADGSGQTQITSGLGSDFPDANAPKWSLDGSKIVFWSGFEKQHGQVWTMRPDGTDARQLTDQPRPINSDDPAWSPDGTKILFDTNRQGSVEIWMMNADGSDQHRLVEGDQQSSWQPLPQIESESPVVSDVALSKTKVKRKTDPTVTITWTSSDNIAVTSHDILFADDGEDFSTTVIAGLAGNEQSFTWTVPDSLPKTGTGRIKIIARDAQGNAGEAVTPKLKIK